MNNGWASNLFSVQRGVCGQGCPLSPYPFILSTEILAKDEDVKDLLVKDTEIKLTQYDTTFIHNGSGQSLSEVLRILESFGESFGPHT